MAPGLAGRRGRGAAIQGAGVAGEAEPAAVGPAGQELRRGPLAHGFAGDQRWTLGRIKTLIRRLFHVGYTPEGVWKLLRRTAGPARSRCGRRSSATRTPLRCGRPRCGPK